MNIFQILAGLYTKTDAKWMQPIPETEIQPYLINRWLAMNDSVRKAAHWLDRYVYALPPKMYLTLAWTVLPKSKKAPFIKYIKQVKDDEEFNFIYKKIRKQFQISDNDFEVIKPFIHRAIKEDMVNWFSYYGVSKSVWRTYQLDYHQMKNFNKEEGRPAAKGLEAWGL